MAYNSYFPIGGYLPQYMYAQSPQISPAAASNSQGNIIWVQGEVGAKSYAVAPNTTVQLWDSESQVIYLKSADASGMPSMKILDYTIRDNLPKATQTPSAISYVTQTEFDAFKQEVQKMIGGSTNEPTVPGTTE